MFTRAFVCLVLLVLPALSGCVYYNTFYNARSAASEAALLRESRPPDGAPTSREKELLDRVIEKCAKILRDHPDSSWADDALVLMAEALHQQGKHESALSRLAELRQNHPESGLRDRADYLRGAVLLGKGDPVGAEEALRPLADASPPNDLSDDAMVLVGKARNARRHHDEAAETYLAALERFPRSDRRAEVRILAAENYADVGMLAEAAHQYDQVRREAAAPKVAFEARVRLADTLVRLGDAGGALAVLEELERRTADRDALDRVLLLKGQAHELAGDLGAAVSAYESVTAARARTEGSALALYRIGLIRRDREDDVDAALEVFTRARDESPRGEASRLASRALEDLNALTKHLEAIGRSEGREEAAADTTTAPPSPEETHADALHTSLLPSAEEPDAGPASPDDELAEARFLAAELLLFSMDRPEKALGYYRDVAALHPSSAFAPKAGLAAAWILERRMGDPVGAAQAYAEVAAAYPATDYASFAEDALERLGADGDGGAQAPGP
ncbi:MAG: tetratricopeptide repeat protein [Candidatus Eisenbacteria bacterium]|nr:tetratricopeptide repeat protein [Candidatus Eisenbacteria bacterium]